MDYRQSYSKKMQIVTSLDFDCIVCYSLSVILESGEVQFRQQ